MISTVLLAGLLGSASLAGPYGGSDPGASRKHSTATGALHWETPSIVQLFSGSTAKWDVILKNASWSTVELRDIKAAQAGFGFIDSRWLAPGMSTQIHLQAPTDGLIGLHRFAFHISSSDAGGPQARIVVGAFVDSAYIPEQPVIDLGVQQRGGFSTRTLSLRSFESDRLDLVSVLDKPDWLELSAIARSESDDLQQLELQAGLDSGVANGTFDALVKLRTNLAIQPFVHVRILGTIFDDVVADPFPLRFGAVNKGNPQQRRIRLSSSSEGKLEIRGIRQSSDDLDISLRDCGERCIDVTVVLKAEAVSTPSGQIIVDFAHGHNELVIPYQANVVSETTEILHLGTLQRDSDMTIQGRREPNP